MTLWRGSMPPQTRTCAAASGKADIVWVGSSGLPGRTGPPGIARYLGELQAVRVAPNGAGKTLPPSGCVLTGPKPLCKQA